MQCTKVDLAPRSGLSHPGDEKLPPPATTVLFDSLDYLWFILSAVIARDAEPIAAATPWSTPQPRKVEIVPRGMALGEQLLPPRLVNLRTSPSAIGDRQEPSGLSSSQRWHVQNCQRFFLTSLSSKIAKRPDLCGNGTSRFGRPVKRRWLYT